MSANAKPPAVEIALITGLSGSGKSTVAKSFEDLGYYCVDNLPPTLLRSLLLDPRSHLGDIRQLAVVTDVRAPDFAQELPQLLQDIERREQRVEVLYVDASDETLVRRFSETRRRHPLAESRSLIEAIKEERRLLAELRGVAGTIFDTSEWSIHEVRRQVWNRFGDEQARSPVLMIRLNSFGFKHGIPYGTDLLFDVRFLTNPYFEPELRDLTGDDEAVLEFLRRDNDFEELLDRLEGFLLYLLPHYRKENRSNLSVSVGCTGGRHRSVAVCESLALRLAAAGASCRIDHRDIEKV